MDLHPALRTLVAALACVTPAASALAAPIYFTDFATATTLTPNQAGWEAYRGSGALSLGNNNTFANGWINGSASGVSDEPGSYSTGTQLSQPTFTFTEAFTPVDRSVLEVDTISFFMRNNDLNTAVRVAVRLGTQWFVSNDFFTGTSTTTWNQDVVFSFTDTAAAWRTLDFTPGGGSANGTLVLGPAGSVTSDLPADDLTAAGIFVFNVNNVVRIDNFEITAIPEPGALGLSAAALLALGLRRRSQ